MKVVFLDRDGVINKYPGDKRYVTNTGEFEFIPGSIEGIKKLKTSGFKIFIISNQAGVAKGIYSQKALDKITRKMENALKKQKASIDGIYYCTHLPQEECLCRKPKPGLLHRSLSDANITPAQAFFIGDSFMDMKAAQAFGAKSVLVLSGKEKISRRRQWEFEPDYIFDNLLVAAYYLCAHYG